MKNRFYPCLVAQTRSCINYDKTADHLTANDGEMTLNNRCWCLSSTFFLIVVDAQPQPNYQLNLSI